MAVPRDDNPNPVRQSAGTGDEAADSPLRSLSALWRARLPHRVCAACGYYKDRMVIAKSQTSRPSPRRVDCLRRNSVHDRSGSG